MDAIFVSGIGAYTAGSETVAPWLILAIGAVYLAVALDLFWQGKGGLALAFASYALSNVGLYMAAK